MAATVKLDKPHSHFTNLDIITGRVILQLHSDTAISNIQVKLEGESRTRLANPRNDREKRKAEIEVHKILYKVKSVFPNPDIAQHSSPNAVFTLAPGVYEYPFKFKFPFNNSCSNQNSMMTNLSMVGLRVEVARDTFNHIKKTLPPTLNSFPGEAEIKYYVKTTVVRPQFYKENIRSIAPFNFLPIEPPRMANPHEETYARRQHVFSRPPPPLVQKKSSLFRKQSMPTMPSADVDPIRISVDARLPNPPILTCNEPIPLRLIVNKKSHTTETMYLQLLQIELISYTNIRAHELVRTEPLATLIMSRSNMNIPVGLATDPLGAEWKIDANLWNRLPLPPNIAPTFETCNISRHYELEVRVGLSHGSSGRMMVSNSLLGLLKRLVEKTVRLIRPLLQSQVIVVPLRLAVKVYSGIRPPPALLEAMTANRKLAERPLEDVSTTADESKPPPKPPRPSNQPVEIDSNVFDDEAPPSYEDAMAELISPIDGPRGDYQSSTPALDRSISGTSGPIGDTKTPIIDPDSESHEERVYGNPTGSFSRESSESIDMLPQSPRLRPTSYADSFFEENASSAQTGSLKPSQQPIQQTQNIHNDIQQAQPIPSQAPPRRAFSTGVPNRRPVPNSGQSQGGNAS